MMQRPRARSFFAGGNTAYGFYSLFDHIFKEKNGKMVVLKGGPGTGKSTLMGNLAKGILKQGEEVESFYCSSDSYSLDGVASPTLRFAVIDGTPPHAVDLKLPGVHDEIINLGEFWDAQKLLPHRGKLETINAEIKKSFAAAYGYLEAANLALQGLEGHMEEFVDTWGNKKSIRGLLDRFLDDEPNGKNPRERHLFASAISPEGLVNHYDSILSSCREVYLLTGGLGAGISGYLETIYQILRLKGLSLEVYHCALDPRRMDALVVPEKGIALVKVTDFQPFTLTSEDILCQESLFLGNSRATGSFIEGLIKDYENRFQELMGKGVDCLKRAKALQMEREPYYSKAMDFSRVKKVEEELTARYLA